MGGHVAAAASEQLEVAGLFLIAPAFYMPGYEAIDADAAGITGQRRPRLA